MLQPTLVARFRQFHRKFEKILLSKLHDTEIFASESRLLIIISNNPNATQRLLAERMNTSPASVGVILKKLAAKGYITKIENSHDPRANTIKLTKKGDDFKIYARTIFSSLDEKILANFSKDELDTFMSYMQRIHSNLDNILEEDE